MSHPRSAGDPAADFKLCDPDGAEFDSREARRRGLLLYVIYKRGCGTCRYTLPFIQRFHNRYAKNGAVVWGISQDSAQETRDTAAELGLTFPLLLDENLNVTVDHKLITVPGIYLVDESDAILRHASAFVKAEINAMAAEAARRTGGDPSLLITDQDSAPVLKPG